MNIEEDFVNEIGFNHDNNNPYYYSRKFKNSLDFEKLKSDEYLNYKLKEKIYNYLISLNLNEKTKEEIFLLCKKFKKKIRENILIPIASYFVIKKNNIPISQNELFKKLNFRKSWYLKYAKYFNNKELNILDNNKNTSQKSKNKKKQEKLDNSLKEEVIKYEIIENKNLIKTQNELQIKNFTENTIDNLSSNESLERKCEEIKNEESNINLKKCVEFSLSKNEQNDLISENQIKNEQKNKNEIFNFNFEKNFLNTKSYLDTEVKKSIIPEFLHRFHKNKKSKNEMNSKQENNFTLDILDKNKELFLINLKGVELENNFENKKKFDQKSNEENNLLITTFTNFIIRMKEYYKNNSSNFKNYFISDLGEKTQKKKDFSYNSKNLEEKIDYIYSEFTCINDSKKNNNNFNFLNNFNILQNKSFDYLKVFDEVLIQAKIIFTENILFFINLNLNKEIKCLSLLRFLLELKGLKVKLQNFSDLFGISISSISKTCKIFKIFFQNKNK